jgi:hypothetical protein
MAGMVFFAMFALDFVWARYTYAMTAKRAGAASGYAGAIVLLSGTAAIGYTSDPWLLVPAVCGAVMGTWLAVKIS